MDLYKGLMITSYMITVNPIVVLSIQPAALLVLHIYTFHRRIYIPLNDIPSE